jgi:hypothetical protein
MAFNFNLGGSTGKYWNQFADNFRGGGEGRNIWTGLTKNWQGLKANPSLNMWGNKAADAFPFKWGDEQGKVGIYEHNKAWYMDKSRKFSPLWEGGLTKPGGSTQDLLDWGEDIAMKSSHHLFGTDYFADKKRGSGGGGSEVALSEAEDPSLINQGNWQRPGEIESHLRREQEMNRGVLAHDLTKNQRGRQTVATV